MLEYYLRRDPPEPRLRRALLDPLTGPFELIEHLGVDEPLEVNEPIEAEAGALSVASGRSSSLSVLTLSRRLWPLFLVAAAGIAAGPAAAQTTPGASPDILVTSRPKPAPDTLPTPVGLVQVEVVVTDLHHHPVTGLEEAAFSLEEDGRPQRLVSVQAVDLPGSAAPESATPRPPRVSTNAVGASPSSGRHFVVVFDDLHLGPAGALQAREVCERFLTDHTRPGDQVTLVAPGEGLVLSLAMPAGRARLAALTSALRGRRETASVTNDEARRRRRRLLSTLAAALEVLPGAGARQSVLLVSEGFTYESGDPASYEVIAASQRANAVLHFLDVRGPTKGRRPVGQRTAGNGRGESTGAEILTTITGGSAIRDMGNLAEALDRLSREADHHYVLAYHPQGQRRGGQLRKIHVGVSRPDVIVRARRGYYEAPDPGPGADDEAAPLPDPLRDALGASSLIRQIPLRLTALAGAPAGDGQVQVTFASEVNAGGLKLACPTSHGSRGWMSCWRSATSAPRRIRSRPWSASRSGFPGAPGQRTPGCPFSVRSRCRRDTARSRSRCGTGAAGPSGPRSTTW